jgi:hypothetical protein
MQKLARVGFVVVLVLGGMAAAQEAMNDHQPPKVLQVIREFTKPGRAGAIHEKSESAFVQAFARAKWPTHYIAATSLSGKNRTLFFVGYDSFAAWEKDAMAQQANTQLTSALDRASMADGDLLSDMDTTVLMYRPDQSLRPEGDLSHMRLMEISVFRVKPGHRKDWDDLLKLVMDAYEKVPDAHWVTYESQYSAEGGAYVVFVPQKSGADIDKSLTDDKAFVDAMGEEGMKKLRDLEAACIDSSMTNLFVFNPAMSYAPDEWVKADPFWKAKPAAAAKPKAEAKPATQP